MLSAAIPTQRCFAAFPAQVASRRFWLLLRRMGGLGRKVVGESLCGHSETIAPKWDLGKPVLMRLLRYARKDKRLNSIPSYNYPLLSAISLACGEHQALAA